MADSDTAFTGSIPQLYDHHMGALFFAPYAADLAKRLSGIAAGEILETAAGTGIVTAAMAASLPPAVTITATDLNQPMLDHAATKPGLGQVRFRQANAQELPFPDGSFDAVICQFGVMFFPDKVQGYREARRVLKPGGRLIFNVWDKLSANPVFDAVVAGLKRRYPAHASWFLERTPCGYHDEARISADLGAGGFADRVIERVTLSGVAGDHRGPAIGLCQGSPMSAEILELDPGGLEAATEAAAAVIAERFGAGPFEAPLCALVVETRKA
jgi:SAM-dependent methyltransferase